MGKCLKKFLTHSAYESYIGGKPILPNVSICEDETNVVHYNPYVEPIKALKFTATGASTLGLTNNGGNAPVLEKSTDGESWSSWDYSTINLADGESVYIRGNNPNGFSSSNSKCSKFTMTGSIACEGNIMHLLSYEEDLTVIPCAYCYAAMFYDCTSLTTAPELPAMTLTLRGYYNMFYGCTSLTAAPELPATTLAGGCYQGMFQNCTSLTTASELPATTLANSCYESMFRSCTNLTAAPELPATTLADSCYGSMFRDCTGLNSITMLATDVSVFNCLSKWTSGVSSTGTFTKKSGVSIQSGVDGIPAGWTVVEV